MRKVVLTLLAALWFSICSVQASPNSGPGAMYFGDYSNANPAPTSGTLTGVYRTRADWVQTGPIICNGCRMKFGGKVTFNNTVTVSAGVEGNGGSMGEIYNDGVSTLIYARGNGPGGGGGEYSQGGSTHYGSGGGHGGAGGKGSSDNVPPASPTYPLDLFLPGSGGGFTGADGGGGFYVEAIGDVTFTSSAAVHADGASGAVAAGSGGGIDVRSLGNININSGAVISANGANAGGGHGGSGGGGYVSMMPGIGKSVVNNGTVTVSHGTGGFVGSDGVIIIPAPFNGPRLTY